MKYFHLRVERPFRLREMIHIIGKEAGLLQPYCGQLQENPVVLCDLKGWFSPGSGCASPAASLLRERERLTLT